MQSGPDSAKAQWITQIDQRLNEIAQSNLPFVTQIFHQLRPGGVGDFDYCVWQRETVERWLRIPNLPVSARRVLGEFVQKLALDLELLQMQEKRRLMEAIERRRRELEASKQALLAQMAERERQARFRAELLRNAQALQQQVAANPQAVNALISLDQTAVGTGTSMDTGADISQSVASDIDMVVSDTSVSVNNVSDNNAPAPQQPAPLNVASLDYRQLEAMPLPRPDAAAEAGYLVFNRQELAYYRVAQATGNFEAWDGYSWQPTNAYYLRLNLFLKQNPIPAPRFTCDGAEVKVDWDHLLQHTFAHLRQLGSLDVKEKHTLWPPGVDSTAIAPMLQAALDNWATTGSDTTGTPYGPAKLAWRPQQQGRWVKTFFLLSSQYQYTVNETDDLMGLLFG